MKRLYTIILTLLLVLPTVAQQKAIPFEQVDPESYGFSEKRLARIDSMLQSHVDRQELAGAVSLVVRDGGAVLYKPYGWADVEARKPMTRETIFRIASMSKAVTTIAVMMLYEEGRFLLNDPISKYLPEFKDMKVAVANPDTAAGAPRYLLQPVHRPITIKHLLTHTAGYGYGEGPATELYAAAGFKNWYLLDRNETIGEAVSRLATLPLTQQPGEVFIYGYATDILGRFVEVMSGMPLDQFFKTRIFDPLKMPDTSFYLPTEKLDRLATLYGIREGKIYRVGDNEKSDYVVGPRKLFSGGAGLLSTITDYGRMLQMLLNEGELDGVRLLSPKTVQLMRSNAVGDLYIWEPRGFGLGFWVIDDLGRNGELGSEGAYGWGSAYHPIYWIDPEERMFGIVMMQLMPAGDKNINNRFNAMTYQALID